MDGHRSVILFLAPWVTLGGADRGTVDWFRTLPKHLFRAYLVTTQPSPNELFDAAAAYADGAWALPDFVPERDMPAFVARLVAERRVDVLHVMNSRLGFDLIPAVKRAFPHLKVVVQLHAEEEHPEWGPWGYPRYVAHRYDDWVDAYSLVSRELLARMLGYGVDPAKEHVIHLGVDGAVFHPEVVAPVRLVRHGPDEFRVLFPARLTEQKDPLLMIEVARRLRDLGSRTVIDVVGDGELRPALEEAVERFALGDRVVIHGASREMPGWYAATDATLLTSRYEGIPLTIYESMAMARPVVTSRVGGNDEVVDDRTGILIDNRADVDAYAQAILRLERDPAWAHHLGRAARARLLASFTVEAMAAAHARLYVELTAGTPAASHEPVDLDGFEHWAADDTLPLFLRPSPSGVPELVTGEPGKFDVAVGRLFTRPVADTPPFSRIGNAYVVGSESGQRLGYVSTNPLPGSTDLRQAVDDALARLRVTAGDPSLAGIELDTDIPCWIDRPDPEPPTARRRSRRRRSGSLLRA